MKKRMCGILGIILVSLNSTYAITSSDSFERAFEEGIIPSLRLEEGKSLFITRQEAAPILVNYISFVAKKEYKGELCKAKDIESANDLYENDLKLLCDYGILRGSGGKIYPNRALTTQEALALVMRIVDGFQIEKKQTNNRAMNYYNRAQELGFNAIPAVGKNSKLITIEGLINFLYSTAHPGERVYESTNKNTTNKNTTNKETSSFKTSNDALLRLAEILTSY